MSFFLHSYTIRVQVDCHGRMQIYYYTTTLVFFLFHTSLELTFFPVMYIYKFVTLHGICCIFVWNYISPLFFVCVRAWMNEWIKKTNKRIIIKVNKWTNSIKETLDLLFFSSFLIQSFAFALKKKSVATIHTCCLM